MRRKIITGLIIGTVAGIIDVIPMLIMGLSWDANLSAFFLWMVNGFMLAVTVFPFRGILKGLAISFLILLPNLFIIAWNDPFSLIPIIIMTLMLGSLSGLVYQRIIKEG